MINSISGFPEWLPAQQMLFDHWRQKTAAHFERFGFTNMETPVVERLETLLSKGDDHEIYGLHRVTDPGGESSNRLGLRFDLTVPLARYIAQHNGQLTFPYRRYQIAPVWRGERPQEGRYRQFYQCDIDIIGRSNISIIYDAEIAYIMWQLINNELDLGENVLLINHRGVLLSWISYAEISNSKEALRLIDKRGKIPMNSIISGLEKLGALPKALDIMNHWAAAKMNLEDYATQLSTINLGPAFQQAVRDLLHVVEKMIMMGIPSKNIFIDPLLARGLQYYSGTIYEFFLTDKPSLGAVCAGGRYAHLTESFTKQSFPGVGMSFGLSRLFPAFLDRCSARSTSADVLVTVQEIEYLEHYLALAALFRRHNLKVEVYLNEHDLTKQLKYANSKGVPFVVMANREEIQQKTLQIKNMTSGQQIGVPQNQSCDYLLHQLASINEKNLYVL